MMPPREAAGIRGTVITTETPVSPEDPDNYEYPFPSSDNRMLFQKYRGMAEAEKDVLICGRLGEYKYYDMDHAVARATTLAGRVLSGDSPASALRGPS